VVRKVASSSRHGAQALAAALAVACAVAGCGIEPPARGQPGRKTMRRAHAYTAVLATRHPLWDALVGLETALQEMGADEWDPVLDPMDEQLREIAFLESLALADPGDRLLHLQRSWEDSYPRVELAGGGLSADFEARGVWERARADRVIADRMAVARSQESRRLAALRTRLVKQYQERLTNLGIDASIHEGELAEAASRERERVRDAIDAQVEAERLAGERMLAELLQRLRQEADARMEAVRARAEEAGSRREAAMQDAGADLYEEMAQAMSRSWPGPPEADVSVSVAADGANARLEAAESSRQVAEEARRRALELQSRRMLRALGRLRSRIKSGTERAARVVAYRDGIDLQLVPGGERVGDDVTDTVGRELQYFWSAGSRQRS